MGVDVVSHLPFVWGEKQITTVATIIRIQITGGVIMRARCERSLIVVNQCFAIARNSRYYSTNYGSSTKQVRDRALRSCQQAGGDKCEIIVAQCNN